MYSVQVLAANAIESPGCGVANAVVTLKVDGQATSAAVQWDNTQAWEVPLAAGTQRYVYLPLVKR